MNWNNNPNRLRMEEYKVKNMYPSRFRIGTAIDFLLEVACMDENRTILFIDFVFYEPTRRLLYSWSMPGYEPHGFLFWGAEFISQAPQWYPAEHTFFVYFRRNGRHFGCGIPALKHREWNHCVSWSRCSILGQVHPQSWSLVQCNSVFSKGIRYRSVQPACSDRIPCFNLSPPHAERGRFISPTILT